MSIYIREPSMTLLSFSMARLLGLERRRRITVFGLRYHITIPRSRLMRIVAIAH
jgi:hypothetical protein